jgi:ATP-dependent Lhr-like helicase
VREPDIKTLKTTTTHFDPEEMARRATLTEEEQKMLARTRKTADIVLSYGKKGIMALLIWGIGPQTAAQVLAKMHRWEEDLFADLLMAKLKYIQTRPFWD